MSSNPSSLKRTILLVLLVAAAIGAYLGWQPIKGTWFPAVPSDIGERYLCVRTGASFEDVMGALKKGRFIQDEANFRWLAQQMNYKKDPMRPGRFEIKPGWTNRQLIQHLRSGEQSPVKVVLNNERLPEEVAGQVAGFIEADSLELLRTFQDDAFLREIGYARETLLCAFIPNTYEMYWNTDPKAFVKRMLKEHEAFWSKNDRRKKVKALGLDEKKAYILASIVERETNHNPEKPTIAGVYLNRLRIDMKLQADPTSVFATRDFATRRVTQFHTTFDSPYNTYMYKGLPPGPISMASIPSLDAVVNVAEHDYLYFCAKPDESGTHAFAATFAGHKVNADRFQAYISKVRGLPGR